MTNRAHQIAALRLPLDQLPDPLPIPVIEEPFDVAIRPPGSKSITNRALLLAALADGTSELRGPLIDADDAQVMLRAIQQLGAKVEIVRGSAGGLDVVRITGVNGRWKIPAGQTITLNLNNAGTATRFLTAAAILAPPEAPDGSAKAASIVIDGDARMRERPIRELTDALAQVRAKIEFLSRPGYPPLKVTPGQWWYPDDSVCLTFVRTASSQFISALLMTTLFVPLAPICFRFEESPTSEPYIHMTIKLMRRIGFYLEGTTDIGSAFSMSRNSRWPSARMGQSIGFPAMTLDIEPDASSATYFEAAAALIPGARATINGLDLGPNGSLQGDTQFVRIITASGGAVDHLDKAIRVTGTASILPIETTLEDMPDTAMTAAAIACFASPTSENPTAATTLRGLRTLRVKETDRLAALQTELTKLGAHIEIFKDGDDEGLRITPPPPAAPSALGPAPSALFFDTYNDHRMAMALALIGLKRPNVFIRNPACVAKTYPTFWQDLARLYEP